MRRLSDRRLGAKYGEEGANPMESVSNLADAMLVLAVGIMLALIINWKVDISSLAYVSPSGDTDTENALTFDEEDMETLDGDEEKVNGESLQELGTVYYDADTGTYYIIESKDGE